MLEDMVMIQTGRVVDGKVVVDADAPLPEGAIVGVVIGNVDDDAELTPEQEALIAKSIEEIKRGEVISGEEFLAKLRSRR